MPRILLAALHYFALTFAAGFALGTARTLLLAPALGQTGAVMIEVPFMLAIAWIACGSAIRVWHVAPARTGRLAIGALAFLFLLLAETAVGVGLLGRSLAQQIATYRELPALIGLAAQVAYAAFPLLRR